jgi:ribose transport system ATP-binding protein
MPADRRTCGLIPEFTVAENVTLPSIGESWRRGHISRRAERDDVRHWLDVTDVQPPDPQRLVQELSGGNQQKVMLAKALRLGPRVLVLAEPTQAEDVGASAALRRLITELANDERAILVASSDAEELEQVCNRVLVTRSGRIACELTGSEITEDRILLESQFEGASA